jgi:DNA repair protein MmcB-like
MGTKMKMTEAQVARVIDAHRHGNDFVITHVKSGATWWNHNLKIMDLVAIKLSWANPCFTGYEIKCSRQDFLGDEKWPGYMDYCHRFSFACPKGVITKDDIQNLPIKGVGLVTINDQGKPFTVVKSQYRPVDISPDFLMAIIFNKLEPDRYPFYGTREAYLRGWLDNKVRNGELGRLVKSKLINELGKIEDRIREIERVAEHEREVVKQLSDKFGIYWAGQLTAKLDKLEMVRQIMEDYPDFFTGLVRFVNEMKTADRVPEIEGQKG